MRDKEETAICGLARGELQEQEASLLEMTPSPTTVSSLWLLVVALWHATGTFPAVASVAVSCQLSSLQFFPCPH